MTAISGLSYEKRLMRVIDYIYGHLDSDLSLDAIADVAALSRFHWHRIYRALAGETVAETIRRVRLNRAAHELVQSTHGVAEIGSRCGYPTARSFERSFLEAYGVTPARFRTIGRLPAPIAPADGPAPVLMAIDQRMLAPIRLASIVHVGPFQEIGTTMHKALALVKTRQMETAGAPMAIFLTDPDLVAPHELRAEVGVPVAAGTALLSPFHEVTVAGRYAVGRYVGPYTGLQAAWDTFCAQLAAEPAIVLGDAPTFEVYLDDPNEVTPTALLTEMYMPIA